MFNVTLTHTCMGRSYSGIDATILFVLMNHSHTAPSAAPTSVSATSTSSSITVQWGMVPCIHRNGDITGYSVQYWLAVGSGSIQTLPIIESDAMMTTIPALMSSAVYSIQVAAVNNLDLETTVYLLH